MATITLNLPDEQYQLLKQQAEQNNHTVEEEAYKLLNQSLPHEDAELEEKVAALVLLDDKALWNVAQNRLSSKVIKKSENLHFKRESEGLTQNETEQLAALVKKYDEIILLRSEAIRLLMERGKDVSSLKSNKIKSNLGSGWLAPPEGLISKYPS
jgi:plasmid stability protein